MQKQVKAEIALYCYQNICMFAFVSTSMSVGCLYMLCSCAKQRLKENQEKVSQEFNRPNKRFGVVLPTVNNHRRMSNPP